MEKNFDMDSARKDVAVRRPLNIRYHVQAGQEWTYFDAEDEGLVTWFIEKVEGDKIELVKKSGKDIGYRTMWDADKLDARRWKPVDESAGRTVLFPCPSCGEDNPIAIGDYVCEVCRGGLGE